MWGKASFYGSDKRNRWHRVEMSSNGRSWTSVCNGIGGTVTGLTAWDSSTGNEPPTELRCKLCEKLHGKSIR